MVDTDKEHAKMKPMKAPFEKSKLMPSKREALAIAKAQGKKPINLANGNARLEMSEVALQLTAAIIAACVGFACLRCLTHHWHRGQ